MLGRRYWIASDQTRKLKNIHLASLPFSIHTNRTQTHTNTRRTAEHYAYRRSIGIIFAAAEADNNDMV